MRVLRRRLRPSRPRRRRADVIDAGFRLFGALGGIGMWAFLIAIMATSDIRSVWWLIASIVCGLPLIGAFVFACLTVAAMRVDRSFVRAERMARDNPPT